MFIVFMKKKRIHYFRNRKFLPSAYQTSITNTCEHISVAMFVKMILRGSWICIIFTTIAGVFSDFTDFAYAPIISQWFVRVLENYTGSRMELVNTLIIPIIIVLLAWIIPDTIGRIASYYYAKKIEPTIDAKLKITFLNRTMQNSYEFFTNNSTGDAMSSLYKLLMSIKTIIRRTSREIIPHCLTCVAMLGSFIILHWSLFLIMIGYLVSHTLVCVFTYKKISALQARSVNAFTKNIANLTDVIMNFSSVLLFSRKKYELKRAKRLQNTECLRMEISNVFVERVKFIRLLLCFTFCGAGLFADLFYLYANNRIGLADIIYTISSSGVCVGLIGLLQDTFLDMMVEFGQAQQGLNILNGGKVAESIENGTDINGITGQIDIENLSFSYKTNKMIFENQNLHIKAGEKIGLVGHSGAGKTTLISLIIRNLTPTGGKIMIDGVDISGISDKSLEDCISVVSQDTPLFNRSVLENIRYSKPEATMEEIIEVAKKANAHDFIVKLPLDYCTNVGERGMLLSGGERQRILIARAMLKNSPILLLDEATSALDAENEKLVQDALNILMKHKTVIAIAHKLDTLTKMDRIIVLQQGKIVEQGSHDELIKNKDSVYLQLWKTQRECV